MTYSCPDPDLEHVLFHAEPAFESLRNARLFITGGTGFWGIWLMESLSFARSRLKLDLEITLLTRSPKAFSREHPALAAEPWIHLLQGDVRNFVFPENSFTHVIHAATQASDQMNREQPDLMRETILKGTERILEFVSTRGITRYLLASSGAVYGNLPDGMGKVPETYNPENMLSEKVSAYAEGKRAAEVISQEAAERFGFTNITARGFAFVGPHLPLDTHFAIGNFIKDALKGGPIFVKGNGTPRRSYLHAADMAAWLWTILCFGKSGNSYNVGSPESFSIREVAEIVAKCAGLKNAVQVASPAPSGAHASIYVPDIQKARQELSLDMWISLEQAVSRTLFWHRKTGWY